MRTPSTTTAPAARPGATSDFAQRANGGTVGTTTSNSGQPVFGNSAPAKAKTAKRAAAKTSTPSTRSAAGDLWSGFEPSARPSVAAAASSAKSGGMSGTAIAALAALGLGLAGIAGAMSFGMIRSRRRAKADSGTTEM